MEAELGESRYELVFGDVAFSEFVEISEELLDSDLFAINFGFEPIFNVSIRLEVLGLPQNLLSG